MKNELKIFCGGDWLSLSMDKQDYELLDTGEGEKIERFGPYVFVRPYEDAVWKKTLDKKVWEKIDGKFWSSKVGAKSGWTFKNNVQHPMLHKMQKKWEMSYKGVKFLASPTPFRHLGFFPEQSTHWDFIEEKIKSYYSSIFLNREKEMHPSPTLPEGEGEMVPGYFTTDPKLWKRLKDRALDMRKNPTKGEKVAWDVLRRNETEFHFRRQQIIDRFIVDFVCLEKRLIIEVDGDIHDFKKEEDKERSEILKKFGFEIIRFSNEEVINKTDNFLHKVNLKLKTISRNSLSFGEGWGGVNDPNDKSSFGEYRGGVDNSDLRGVDNTNDIKKIKFLNLFGYTGVASLFALRAGAEVTHVDASKQTLEWVKENQKVAGMENMSMRIILDDALKFLAREEKRGIKYDAVIMDPPKFGRGPKGEEWKIERDLPKLLSLVRKVLSDKPLFVILNSYAIDSSALSLGYTLEDTMQGLGGEIKQGELCLLEKSKGRTIPLSNTAIWSL